VVGWLIGVELSYLAMVVLCVFYDPMFLFTLSFCWLLSLHFFYLWDGVTVITGESFIPFLMHSNNIKIKIVLHTVYTTR